MKCIILCAGYGTHLSESNENLPSTLLKVTEDKTILDCILDNIKDLSDINEILIATNNRYYDSLSTYQRNKVYSKKITVINDTTNNSNERLGAVGDIQYLINDQNIEEDLLIILGDNLFTLDLSTMVETFKTKREITIAVQKEETREKLMNFGVLSIDENNRVIGFDERTKSPKANLKSLGIYLFPKESLGYIKGYLEEGNRAETTGYLLTYLYPLVPIITEELIGPWFDINTEEELQEVKKLF